MLYATPTQDQIARFWFEVTTALAEPVAAKVFYKNETKHIIGLPEVESHIINLRDNPTEGDGVPGMEARIRAKTAWNADTLRGDFADLLILDEYQLMSEDAWELVGAPMLLDNDGDAVFIYTPPSAISRSVSKARDKMHAAKFYKKAEQDTTGRYQVFHFTSHDNPHISEEALAEIVKDMTERAYNQEIMAQDLEDTPGALWERKDIEDNRVGLKVKSVPDFSRVIIAVDPSVSSTETSDECGIVAVGAALCNCKGLKDTQGNPKPELHAFVLADGTERASPDKWARDAVKMYYQREGDLIVGEVNNGGEMVGMTIRTVDPNVPYKAVTATRGKQTRAQPIASRYQQGRVHHVGVFQALEDELCNWVPLSGMKSPNHLDALVWGLTEIFGMVSAEEWLDSLKRKDEQPAPQLQRVESAGVGDNNAFYELEITPQQQRAIGMPPPVGHAQGAQPKLPQRRGF